MTLNISKQPLKSQLCCVTLC